MNAGTIAAVVAIVLLAWLVYVRMKPAKGLATLSAGEFREEMKRKRRIVDVREPGEYRSGFIAGASNIPLSQLQRRLREIPKDQPVLLYCRSGMRSRTAARILLKNGYREIAHLRGGLGGWDGPLAQ